MNTGTSGSVSSMRAPTSGRPWRRAPARRRGRRRRARAAGGSARSTPRAPRPPGPTRRRPRRPARRRCASGCVRSRPPARSRRSSDRTLAAARRPATSIPQASAPRTANAATSAAAAAPRRADGSRPNARVTTPARTVAWTITGAGRRDPHRRVRDQQGARRARAGDEPRVERAHGRILADQAGGRARPAGHGGAAAARERCLPGEAAADPDRAGAGLSPGLGRPPYATSP